MRTSALALLLLLLGAAFATQAGAQTLLVDYLGYDYEFPNPDTTQFGEIGAGYVGLGEVPGLFSPLVADTSANQYTYYISGLTVSAVTPVGSFVIVDYSGPGTLDVYEDSKSTGTDALYGVYPPNGTAPSTFVDGTLFLRGNLTGFQIVLNTSTGSGSYSATFDATGGSQIGNIPVGQRSGWTFAGQTTNDINRPAGYAHQVDGQVFLNATPVRETTWGRLKNLYN